MCQCNSTRCYLCGPRQGNNYCIACGAWDDEGGCDSPASCQADIADWDRRGREDAMAMDDHVKQREKEWGEEAGDWDTDEDVFWDVEPIDLPF